MRFGCYNVFGLVYHYNNLVRPVPLRGVSVDAHIVDFVVRTAISQHFHNTESFPIEASYVFPIDERAAVCGFEVDIDGVITKGVVQEKHEARATYDQAVARGDGAQLLEQKRTDVFELTVGNLLPGQHATVNIITVADLKIEGDDVRFFLPTFVAPRYHPYTEHDPVPSGTVSRVRDGLQLTINCTMSQAITGIVSPSHPVVTAHMPQSKTANVSLAAGTMQLDKDFVLLVRTEQPHEPRVSVEIAEDGSVATMITLAPNIELDDEQCELVFVVDRSGSMSGSKIDQARKAMALFFRSLPSDCFINIVGFGSSFRKLWPTPTKYSDESLRQGSAHIASINADLGGTELLEPLREIFATPLIPGYNRQVFVLTDGEVSNTSAVIDLVRANQGSARVFALGLGEGASHELVEGIARAGRGTAEFVVNDRLEAKVIGQLKTAIQPALNDVTVEWDIPTDATFVDPSAQPNNPAPTVAGTIGSLLSFRKPPPPKRYYTQAPFKVPSILTSTRFLVFCISPPGHRNPTSAIVKARTPLGPLAVQVSARPEDYIRGDVIHKMAARAAIRDLEEGTSYQHSLSGTDRVSEADITREIVRLGVEHQLTSKHTSYVAVQPHNPSVIQYVYLGSVVLKQEPKQSPPMMQSAPMMRSAAAPMMYASASPPSRARCSPPPAPMSSARSISPSQSAKLLQVQDEVNSVTNIMRSNMERVLDRDSRLDSLCNQSERLSESSLKFKKEAASSSSSGGFFGLFRKSTTPPPSTTPPRATTPPKLSAAKASPPPAPKMDCASYDDEDAEDDAVPVASVVKEEKKSVTPPRATTPSRSPEESQQRLAALQRFDGGFALGNDLAAIVGKSVADLTAASATVFAGNTVPSDIFATALAIWFFENRLSHLEDEWQLIVGKARKWLAKANKTSLSVAELVSLSGSAL